MPKEDVIKIMKDSLASNLPIGSKAILFGSRARGDSHSGSDWDVLILLDKDKLENKDYDTISFPLRMIGWKISEEINPIIYTTKEWNENSFTPFYHNVISEGIDLI